MKLRLLKFGTKTCHYCNSMEKKQTLERLVAKFPKLSLQVVKLDIADEKDETPAGSEYERNNKLAEAFDVDSLPTLILELQGSTTLELNRAEGDASVTELSRWLKESIEQVEEMASPEESSQLPWA